MSCSFQLGVFPLAIFSSCFPCFNFRAFVLKFYSSGLLQIFRAVLLFTYLSGSACCVCCFCYFYGFCVFGKCCVYFVDWPLLTSLCLCPLMLCFVAGFILFCLSFLLPGNFSMLFRIFARCAFILFLHATIFPVCRK